MTACRFVGKGVLLFATTFVLGRDGFSDNHALDVESLEFDLFNPKAGSSFWNNTAVCLLVLLKVLEADVDLESALDVACSTFLAEAVDISTQKEVRAGSLWRFRMYQKQICFCFLFWGRYFYGWTV